MGRTVLPFSRVLEQEVQEWRKFRRGLRKEDQQFLDRLFEEARLHVQAGVYASRPWPFETILVSILLEHEKALVELRSKLRAWKRGKESVAGGVSLGTLPPALNRSRLPRTCWRAGPGAGRLFEAKDSASYLKRSLSLAKRSSIL